MEPNVVFYDDFNDQNDDGWFREIVGGGAISVSAGQYCFFSDAAGWLRSTVIGLDVANLTYNLDLIPHEGFGLMRIFFRFRDPTTYYQISMDGMQGWLEKQTPAGIGEPLASFPCTLVEQTQYDFRIQADAGLLQGWYRWQDTDWIPLFRVVDPDYIPAGTIGLGAARGKHVHFDNVLVQDNGVAGVPGGNALLDPESAVDLGFGSPNPFDRLTVLPLAVRRGGPISLSVFDVGGALVRRLVDRDLPAGDYRIEWDGRGSDGNQVGSGIYFCRLAGGKGRAQTQRLLMVR
ncbi:MAG: hypothetical protein FJY88_10460 [Candidatus Eisenbacteria bacterium]|nr:hypothetical protein [Candidatus Eisenbacteria bacterium]